VLLVANQFLDYRAPAAKRFAEVEVVAREKGYAVYRLVKAAG
jgi:16S rRNA G1207 methylase RsmC